MVSAASARPHVTPTSGQSIAPRARKNRSTVPRPAPRAMRTPISGVRSVTQPPTTAKRPTAASVAAMPANVASSDAAKRQVATDRATMAVTGSTSPTGRRGSMAAASCPNDGRHLLRTERRLDDDPNHGDGLIREGHVDLRSRRQPTAGIPHVTRDSDDRLGRRGGQVTLEQRVADRVGPAPATCGSPSSRSQSRRRLPGRRVS